MRLRRARPASFDHRLVWQGASLLLDYPGNDWAQRLAVAEKLVRQISPATGSPLVDAWSRLSKMSAAQAQVRYVETFDMRKRATLYLTYWTAGDTRNRGREILRFADAYRQAGTTPPSAESADHLTVVLEFAATVDPVAGARLLGEHATPLQMLHLVLADEGSEYAPVLEAVCATLDMDSGLEEERARRLAAEGPPAESVGLAPFTLTVPPRRSDPRQEVG